MNRIILNIVIAAFALASANAVAQTVSIGSASGAAGADVPVPVTFTTGANALGSFTVLVTFDPAKFSNVTFDCDVANLGQLFESCGQGAGFVQLGMVGNGTDALVSGMVANLTFTIADPVAFGPVPLNGAATAAGTPDGQDLDPASDFVFVSGGAVTVLGPVYSSSPPPGAGGATEFAFGPVIEGNPVASQGLTIENTGAAGTTLSGLCSLTSNPDGAFLTNGDLGDEPFSSTPSAVSIISVSCDSSKPFEGSVYNGTLTCAHNGTNAGDAIYDLSCTITDGPHPAFTATPSPLTFTAVEAGDVMPPQNSTVTNTGDTPSNLVTAPACTLMGTNAGSYSLSGQTSYDIDTAGSAVLTVQCTATDPGDYNDALVSCPHTDAIAGTGQIGLECHVGDPGPAKFNSTPVLPGDPIDMTPNGDALTGSADPVFTNTIFNDTQDPNDSDLFINCFFTGGGGAITETTSNAGVFIAPNATVPATFACDTTTAGDYNATYSCDYSTDGINDPDDGNYTYAVHCGVRDPESDVVPDPDPSSGTTLQFLIQPGGSGTVSVDFDQILNEAGADDAFVNSCWIDGADQGAFQVIAPPSFPAAIQPLGTVTVTVEGTDNNAQDSYSATLHCAYSDSDTDYCEVGQTGGGDAPAGDVECEVASYPLLMEVGGDATFRVSKDFTDGVNPTLVDVTLSCFTGLPLVQTQTISETQDVNFIVQSFVSGELDCSITEDLDLLQGYTPIYLSGGDTGSTNNVGGCNFDNVVGGDENSCRITNNAKPVDVTLEKVWLVEGSGGDFVDRKFTLTLTCDTFIAGGSTNCGVGSGQDAPDNHDATWCQDYTGEGDQKWIAKVTPKYPMSNCSVKETIYDDAVDSYLGECPPMVIKANQGADCKVTNTVFFEGIPTLNQYGLAILALLMLGMGMVGFRRFV